MKTKTFISFKRSLYSLFCGLCVSFFMVALVAIADASDIDIAKQLATNDALSRDWNLTSYGSNYTPTACSKIDISSVENTGDGIYTVKAKLTLTTTYTYGSSTYTYTFIEDVEYSVDPISGKVKKFVYAPNNQYRAVAVELYQDKEVKTTHYQTQYYSFDSIATVSLGSDGKRTKEVGTSVSKSFYGNTVYESDNAWEKIYDADGKYPTKYTATYESKTNGVVTYSGKQVTVYGTLGRAIEYSSEYKSIYNNTIYISAYLTKYDPVTFKVMSTNSTSATYVNGKLTNESSYSYVYNNGRVTSYVYTSATYDASGNQTASSRQETLYGATGRVIEYRGESKRVYSNYTYLNSYVTKYDPLTYKIVSSSGTSATYVNGKLTNESSYKYEYNNGIIKSYVYNSATYDASGKQTGYYKQEALYGATGRIIEYSGESKYIYSNYTYLSSYSSKYDPATYKIISSSGTSATYVNDKMTSRTAYIYKYNSLGRMVEYTYISSRFDANGIVIESSTVVSHYTDSGVIDKRDTTGNVFGKNGITLATYAINCVFDAAGRLTGQSGSINMSGIDLSLKYDVKNGAVMYTHVIDEYGNELQRFGGAYTISIANIVNGYVKEVTDRVNGASFNLDFNGDGKLTVDGDYGLLKWFISGNPSLLSYLTSAAKAKLDLDQDGVLNSDDVALFGAMISDVDKLIEFAKILNIGADLRFDINGDGKTDAGDLPVMEMALEYRTDINGDGVIDQADAASLAKTLDGSLDLDGDGIFDYNDYYYLYDAMYKMQSTYTAFNDNTNIYVYGWYYTISENEDGTYTMTDYYGRSATSAADGTIELNGEKYSIAIVNDVINMKAIISPEEFAHLDINSDGVIDYEDMNALYPMLDWRVDVNQDGVFDNTDLEAFVWALETAIDVNGDGVIDMADHSALVALINAASLMSRDVNQDGVIDQTDVDLSVSNYILAVKYASLLPQDTFAILDQNGDGAITGADSALVGGQITKIVEDIDKVKEFADLLKNDPIDVNKDGVIDSKDHDAAIEGYALALKYLEYVPAEVKSSLDRNGDGVVTDEDINIVAADIDEYIAVIKAARENVDNLVYDEAEDYYGNIEDYIELVDVTKLDNGNFRALVRVDNFDFEVEVYKYYYGYYYAYTVSVIDTTGNYPGKIEDNIASLFNCDKSDILLDMDYWYGGFYNKTAGTVNWSGYVTIDGNWIRISGIYNIDTLDAGVDASILEPILAAKNDIMVYLHVAAENIRIISMWWGYVEASAGEFKMQYSYNTEYDYYTNTSKMTDFKLKAIINSSGKDIYGAALTYLAGVLNVNKENINISTYSLEADGTIKFVLKHNGNRYEVSVKIGTGEIIVHEPDAQAAKDRVTQDALSRDWNFNIEAGTYEGETYIRIECDNVAIKSITDMGNGLYEVKADITLKEAREYGYSYTRAVTYYVGKEMNNITKFVYSGDYYSGAVTVEMLDLKEVVSLSDYWNTSNYEVHLAIDGTRVNQTGVSSGSYSWYDYSSGKTITSTYATTWERVFDAGGQFPVSYKSKYEYKSDNLLKDVTEKSIEYFSAGKMSVYSNHSKSYSDDGRILYEENSDVAWNESGVMLDNAYKYAEYGNYWEVTYLNEWHYSYFDTGIMKSIMTHDIYNYYDGRKFDSLREIEYDETGYKMVSEYGMKTVVKNGRTIEYWYKNAVYDASGNYASLYESNYRLNDDGSYGYWMSHNVYTEYWTGQKVDEYQSYNYDANGSIKSASYQKSVYNRNGGLIENGCKYTSYGDDGVVTYLDEWRYNYWDDGKQKSRFNHSISTNSYTGERTEYSWSGEYDESGWRLLNENGYRTVSKDGRTIQHWSKYAVYDAEGNCTSLSEYSYTLNGNWTYKTYSNHSIWIDYWSGQKTDRSENRNYDTSGTLVSLNDYSYTYWRNGNLKATYQHSIYTNSYTGLTTDESSNYEYDESGWRMINENRWRNIKKDGRTDSYWSRNATYNGNGTCTYLSEYSYAMNANNTYKSYMTHYIYTEYSYYGTGNKVDDYQNRDYDENGKLKDEQKTRYVWNKDGTLIENSGKYANYDTATGAYTYLDDWQNLYFDNGNLERLMNHNIYIDTYSGQKTDDYRTSEYELVTYPGGYEYSVRVREYVDRTVTKGSVVIEDWNKDALYDTEGNCTYLWETDRAKYDDGTDKSVMTHYIYSDYWSGNKTDDYSKKTYHADGTLSGENINKSVWNSAGTRLEYEYLYSTYNEEGTLTYLSENHYFYWDNGRTKSEHNHYVYTDSYTGKKKDQSTDSTYDVNGIRTSYIERVSNYDANGALADSYSLNRGYNSAGSLTSMEGSIVVPSAEGTQVSYRVVYDINENGYITYTHVYDAEGQEIADLGGQYYIHPTNIITAIKESQNAEIEANAASGVIVPEASAAVSGDEDAYKVLDLKEQIDLQKQSTNGIPVYSEPKTNEDSLTQNHLTQ